MIDELVRQSSLFELCALKKESCPACGLVLDRNENAAKNIERAGQALRGAVA